MRARGTKETKTKKLEVMIEPSKAEEYRNIAAAKGLELSAWVRMVLEDAAKVAR